MPARPGSRRPPADVVARDPGRLPADVRERVEVVPGSHRDADVVTKAFAGADAVFWLAADPRAANARAAYVDFSRAAVEVFARGEVGRVVGISALGRGTPQAVRAGHVTASLAMDDLIAATGVPFRALTLPSFMENVARQVEPIRNEGIFVSPLSGDRAMPTCATRDIAAVAAGLLLDPGWEGRGDVPVLGPEDLSTEDMARIMSEVLDRPVRFRRISGEAFKAGLIERGMSEGLAQDQLDMARAKDDGMDNAEPRTPSATTPTTFRRWCEEALAPAVRG